MDEKKSRLPVNAENRAEDGQDEYLGADESLIEFGKKMRASQLEALQKQINIVDERSARTPQKEDLS